MKQSMRLLMVAPCLATLMLAACNNATPAAPPTQPPPPPTATLAPTATTAPTATPAPAATEAASGTDASAAGKDANSAFTAAITKFAAASSYRADLEMKGKGNLGLSTDDSSTPAASQDVSLFVLSGEFKGADSHYTLKGFLSTLLGVAADKGIEALVAGGKAYVHGPVSLLGATEDKWYVLDTGQSEAIQPPIEAAAFLSGLGNGSVDLSALKMSGNESIDGQTCDIYTADKTVTMKAFDALNTGSIPGAADLSSVQNAAATFALCADGYLHRVRMSVDTAAKDDPTKKATFTMELHVHDFSAAVTITPPTDAIPLQAADMNLATATPKK